MYWGRTGGVKVPPQYAPKPVSYQLYGGASHFPGIVWRNQWNYINFMIADDCYYGLSGPLHEVIAEGEFICPHLIDFSFSGTV